MVDRNDERLLWKYIDNDTTAEEERFLQERLKTDRQLRHHLRYLQMLDTNLLEAETVPLPEVLKVQIVAKTKNLSRIQTHQVSGSDNKGMISFATFNLAILVFAILISVYNSGWVSSTPQLSILKYYNQIIETPMIRSFFVICIAILTLLFVDHFLKNRNYGKMTTPV